jgi:NDP-sugar pyrophosphorylase family protein
MIDTAVLLSAGLGTRLGARTANKPKVMVDILGKPLLGYHFDWLKRHGVKRALINLHYLPDVIRDYAGDGSAFGLEIRYSLEESLQGTAGALNGFRELVTGTTLVHYGDVYSEMDIGKLAAYHREKRALATLVVHETHRPHDSDVVRLDEGARVLSVHHKPGSYEFGNIGNAASMIVEPEILRYLPKERRAWDWIQDVIPQAIAAGEPVFGYDTDELTMDMGTPERLEKLEALLSARQRA